MTGARATAVTATSPGPLASPDRDSVSVRVGELYEAHGRMVVRLCRLLLRDAVEAQDAAQQTFLSAQRGLLGGSAPRDPRAWLATIARNECLARIRARMREPLPGGEPVSELPDPFQAVVRKADVRALRAELARLAPAQRDAFVLREIAGLSYDELARLLGVSEPAVESLLVRARRRLRQTLGAAVNVAVAPVGLRELVARLAAVGTDDGSVGMAAKLASLPAAKLAAVGAGVALVAGGGSVVLRTPPAEPLARSAAAGLRDEPALLRVPLAAAARVARGVADPRAGRATAPPRRISRPTRGHGGEAALERGERVDARHGDDSGADEDATQPLEAPEREVSHEDQAVSVDVDDRSLQSESPASGPGSGDGASGSDAGSSGAAELHDDLRASSSGEGSSGDGASGPDAVAPGGSDSSGPDGGQSGGSGSSGSHGSGAGEQPDS